MEKSNKNISVSHIVATVLICFTLIGLAVYGVYNNIRAERAERVLENQYHRTFTDLADYVSSAENYLLKALSTSTPGTMSAMLEEASKCSAQAESCLASLPIDQRLVGKISGYLVQLGDIAKTWSRRAVNGGALYLLLNMIRQMRTLSAAGQAMANGDLSYCVDTSDMKHEFREHGENLNSIGRGMAIAVNERMKSERFKTELITNVSHDLKTPLTSIVTYIDLLQKEDIQDEKAKEYIDTIARQSKKLKKLTEDLIDASKASSGALNVNMERVNISELLRQSSAEYGERMQAVPITPVVNMPEEDIYVRADGRLLWRVVENLLQNICKHGMPGTRAYLEARTENGRAVVSFKNISQQQLNIPVEELLERFVQGDEAGAAAVWASA